MNPGQQLLNEWEKAQDKQDPRFWNNEHFRMAYAIKKLGFYSDYYQGDVQDDVLSCVQQLQANPRPNDDTFDHPVWTQMQLQIQGADYRYQEWGTRPAAGGLTVRMLSLGCGPGCDVLAVARILAASGKVACMEFVCIDLLQHPLEGPLYGRLAEIAELSNLQIRLKYLHGTNLVTFVPLCLEWNMKFDLVSARYINAIDVVGMFRGPVPNLLGSVGLVLLMDNCSEPLKNLVNFGYSVRKTNLSNQILLVLATVPLMSSG